MSRLVRDVLECLAALGHTRCTLVAHDWGGMVAWHVAAAHPEAVQRMVVLASPHPRAYLDPACFTPQQSLRSWYFILFQAPRLAAVYMSHSDFKEVDSMLRKAPRGVIVDGTITDQDVDRTKALLGRPGALRAALNYYVASFDNQSRRPDQILKTPLESTISVPLLVLYGQQDAAFLPSMFQDYGRFCADVTTLMVEGCSHWMQQDRCRG
ncbi:hypothetical protein ACKKBF_B00080 [Auxenochlorella protothecoides x Auxenochlorella symbiontica]